MRFVHRHEWGPWITGEFGFSKVRVRACRNCLKVRARGAMGLCTGETAARAIAAARGESVPVYVDDYCGKKSEVTT